MKSYKEFDKEFIGCSDIASLTVKAGEKLYDLTFGEDGRYNAYIVKGEADIPTCYTKVFEADCCWLWIFDDDARKFSTSHLELNFTHVNIYRCGEYGCIIQFL